MENIADLLARHGLGQYIDAFAAAAVVDLDTLRLLTEDDLKELGLPLGHRRKLGAALMHDGGSLITPVLPSQLVAMTEISLGLAAERPEVERLLPERRHLTVLFCDLAGSTELTRRLDPEDMGWVVRAYQDVAAGTIGRFGGFVDQFLGDGVLAFFGYPKADEDAAELAVRAGLEIVEALGKILTPTGEQLAGRVAVASGLVYIDQTVSLAAPGPSGARERVVAGEVVNFAARLQQIAPANGVVVSREARALLRGAFDLEDLGAYAFKGISGPVHAWRAVRERTGAGAGTRFQAARPSGTPLPPMVGREAELALLASRWEAARSGEGQVVLVAGDAGVGKSRLCQALCERIRDEAHFVIRYQCSPLHTHSPLHPVIAQLRRAARIEPELGADENLTRLETLLAHSSPAPERDVPILAALLSIPVALPRYEPLRLVPEAQKRRTMEVLTEQLLGLARRRPVLMLVEDAHWVDPTLHDLLSFAIESAQDAPVLTLVTHRTELQAPWGMLANATTLCLGPLARREARGLIERVMGGQALPPEVVERIVAKADGIPLFVEELTKAVLEQGAATRERDGAHASYAAPLAVNAAIPASLHDSLLARLERLPSAKEVAQVGSVLGREFSHEHLAELSDLPEDALRAALNQLLRAGLIHQRGPQRTCYVFKHALVQDAAYSTLTLERRQRLHARCAEILPRLSPDVSEAQPEVLARHFAKGGDPVRAAEHWLRAGQRAVERSANAEAVAHLTSGLRMLDSEYWLETGQRAVKRSANAEAVAHLTSGLRMLDGVHDTRRRAELEIALQLELGTPLIATRGYGARETVQAWERAHALAKERGEHTQLVQALYGLWAVRVSLGRVREALPLAERVLEIATEVDDGSIALVGHRVRGVTLFFLGEVEAARTDLERAWRDYDPARDRALAFRFGQDQRVAALAVLSAVLWLQGAPEQAHQHALAALNEAEQLGHANTQAYALAYGACALAWMRRDTEELECLADRLILLSERHHLGFWRAYGLSYKGWALSQGDDGECADAGMAARQAGLDLLREAYERFRRAGDGFCDPMHLGMLAEALGNAGVFGEAEARIDEAIAEAEARATVWCLPELLRLKSRLMLRNGGQSADRDGEARRVLHAALDQARRRRLTAWEERVALDLADVHANVGVHATDSQLTEGGCRLPAGTERGEDRDLEAASWTV